MGIIGAAAYILPGARRTEDRIVAASKLTCSHYSPSCDKTLSDAERRYRPNAVLCSVAGEEPKVYPFILGCAYSPEWVTPLYAAADMGLELFVGEPVRDDESIGRSVLTHCIALADGTVYETKRPGSLNVLIVRRWPVSFDPAILSDGQLGQAGH